MKIGYSRVSTKDQSTGLQKQQLSEMGCEKLYVESASGKDANRTQLKAMIDFAREGDVIHVMKVDRLARNTVDALQIADQLKEKGVGLVFHDLGDVDINSQVGRVIYTTIAAFAQMERERILQRANEGRAKAKAEGKHLGRHKDQTMHDEIKRLALEGTPKARIAKLVGCSRATVYNALS